MKVLRGKKGITTTELIVVIAIMGIIFTVSSSFLISNIKVFHLADDQIEVQYNGHMAMEQLVKNIMEAEGIEGIDTTSNVDKYIFRINSNSFIQYDYNEANQTLSRGTGTQSDLKSFDITTKVYATNIVSFDIVMLRDSDTLTNNLNDAIGIEIVITTQVNDSDVDLRNRVFFRNAK